MSFLLFLPLFLSFLRFTRTGAQYCLCKPGSQTPDPYTKVINYACGNGANCGPIQPNGPCYQANNVQALCDYAANSYYQNQKSMGATCDFGSVAALSNTLPSDLPSGCTYPTSAGAGSPPGTISPSGSISPPGGMTSPPVSISPPGGMTSPPGTISPSGSISPPGGMTSPPVSISPPGGMTSPPGSISPPGGMTSPPGSMSPPGGISPPGTFPNSPPGGFSTPPGVFSPMGMGPSGSMSDPGLNHATSLLQTQTYIVSCSLTLLACLSIFLA